MKASNYSYRIIDDYLLIVDNSSDKDNFVSVTNNIENILTEISTKEENIINYNIYYRDTEYNWDQIIIDSIIDNKVEKIKFIISDNRNDEFFENLFFTHL